MTKEHDFEGALNAIDIEEKHLGAKKGYLAYVLNSKHIPAIRAALTAAKGDGWNFDKSAAPRTGEYFTAWDDRNHYALYTIHWDEDMEEFITENEVWSGRWSAWRPSLTSPKTPQDGGDDGI